MGNKIPYFYADNFLRDLIKKMTLILFLACTTSLARMRQTSLSPFLAASFRDRVTYEWFVLVLGWIVLFSVWPDTGYPDIRPDSEPIVPRIQIQQSKGQWYIFMLIYFIDFDFFFILLYLEALLYEYLHFLPLDAIDLPVDVVALLPDLLRPLVHLLLQYRGSIA